MDERSTGEPRPSQTAEGSIVLSTGGGGALRGLGLVFVGDHPATPAGPIREVGIEKQRSWCFTGRLDLAE